MAAQIIADEEALLLGAAMAPARIPSDKPHALRGTAMRFSPRQSSLDAEFLISAPPQAADKIRFDSEIPDLTGMSPSAASH
jgi:hypothetical protein